MEIMVVYRPAPVSDDPEVTLRHWAIIEMSDTKDRHFVGYNIGTRDGRVSSKIVSFDPKTMTGKTRSGRVYKLEGPPGSDGDAEYVLRIWIQNNWGACFTRHEGVPSDWESGYEQKGSCKGNDS